MTKVDLQRVLDLATGPHDTYELLEILASPPVIIVGTLAIFFSAMWVAIRNHGGLY